MYPNYIEDRESLGYKCLLDTQCGNGLVLITDSITDGTVVFIRDVASNAKGKSQKLVVVVTLAGVFWLSNLESAEAIGLPMLPTSVVRVHKPSYDYRSKIKVAPAVSPKLDKITFIKYPELPVCIYMTDEKFIRNVEVNELIKKIRGGSVIEAAAAFIFLGAVILLIKTGYGFQVPVVHPRNGAIVRPANGGWGGFQPPTADHRYPPSYDLFFPRRTSPSDRSGSVLHEGRVNEVCSVQGDEEGFVMSYAEAHKLVAEAYPGFIDVSEVCKISEWQAAKHIYHCKGMGINPADYDFTQKDLELIRKEGDYKEGGLVAYARRGHRLPPIEMVRAYSEKLKEKCEKAPIRLTNVPYYDINGKWPSTVYIIPPVEGERKGIMIVFNESTTDLITGDRQRKAAFTRLEEEGFIGSPKWMREWNNTSTGQTPAPNDGFTPLSSFESDVLGVTPVDSASSDSQI